MGLFSFSPLPLILPYPQTEKLIIGVSTSRSCNCLNQARQKANSTLFPLMSSLLSVDDSISVSLIKLMMTSVFKACFFFHEIELLKNRYDPKNFHTQITTTKNNYFRILMRWSFWKDSKIRNTEKKLWNGPQLSRFISSRILYELFHLFFYRFFFNRFFFFLFKILGRNVTCFWKAQKKGKRRKRLNNKRGGGKIGNKMENGVFPKPSLYLWAPLYIFSSLFSFWDFQY